MQLSLRSLEDLQSKYEAAKRRVTSIKETAQDAIMTVVQTAEIGAMSFGLGVVNGYWSQPEVIGIPITLGLAAVGHGVGFMLDEKAGSQHVHNLADGAFATYCTTLGVGIGAKMLQEKAQAQAAAPART